MDALSVPLVESFSPLSLHCSLTASSRASVIIRCFSAHCQQCWCASTFVIYNVFEKKAIITHGFLRVPPRRSVKSAVILGLIFLSLSPLLQKNTTPLASYESKSWPSALKGAAWHSILPKSPNALARLPSYGQWFCLVPTLHCIHKSPVTPRASAAVCVMLRLKTCGY